MLKKESATKLSEGGLCAAATEAERNRLLYRAIKKALQARAMTYDDLADALGYCKNNVARFMMELKAGKNGSRFMRPKVLCYLHNEIIPKEENNEAD